ncbi:MAG: GNAT family N-acetyltransferase [Gordonia sp. (in: high G+C Gram-positive bacteria)]|uniref:GNAT family N-acetyltransferase n=1 Tax=Gordonia sp. (in: high G+C Gram-positive bacteria) TaxID=84139 RepID=UPI0039E42942
MTDLDLAPLDDPFGSALRGRQRRFARHRGRVCAYDPEVSVFYAHPRDLTAGDWDDLAVLAGPGGTIGLRDRQSPLPDGWEPLTTFDLVLYSGEDLATAPDPELVRLGPGDVPEIIELIAATEPGPFLPRTLDLGTYLGYRDPDDGRLLAMAGERSKPDGWTEISAVCTHPAARGAGLATRLIRAVGDGVVAAGDRPFLHTTADNPARSLYENLGFVRRAQIPLDIVRVPTS